MIIGVVNTHTEATLRLPVRAADGREQEIEAVLDTGFNGSLRMSGLCCAAAYWLLRSILLPGRRCRLPHLHPGPPPLRGREQAGALART